MKKRPTDTPESRSGSLQRNNVYSSDAVRDWAWRIRSGPTGIRMNEKFMLIAMSTSVNPRGVCELPVRYLADHIGVGMRQAQRLIVKLIHYDLVIAMDIAPQGRPNDIVRTFKLNTTIEADTWTPSKTEVPLMRHFRELLRAEVAARRLSEDDFVLLMSLYLFVPRSKRMEFVSPDAEVTKAFYRWERMIVSAVSKFTNLEIRQSHLIPKPGYRH